MSNEQIIFFDGVCNLCNGFINFLIKVDHQKVYKMASLQGQTAKELLPEHFHQQLSTVVLSHNGEISTKSRAVIQIISGLGSFWSLILILNILPFKDYLYEFIARNRYKIFGKKETCRLPTNEERAQFLP